MSREKLSGFKAPGKAKADQSGLKVAAATKTKGSKKKKKEKDPNAPKRSKSSYLYFCEDVRAGLRQENPALSLTDLSREMGRRWKLLEDKTKYEVLAEVEVGGLPPLRSVRILLLLLPRPFGLGSLELGSSGLLHKTRTQPR